MTRPDSTFTDLKRSARALHGGRQVVTTINDSDASWYGSSTGVRPDDEFRVIDLNLLLEHLWETQGADEFTNSGLADALNDCTGPEAHVSKRGARKVGQQLIDYGSVGGGPGAKYRLATSVREQFR